MPAPDYAVEIAALEAAAATGELTVESDGDRITYRNMADLLKALTFFEGRRDAAARGRFGAGSVTLAVFDGG